MQKGRDLVRDNGESQVIKKPSFGKRELLEERERERLSPEETALIHFGNENRNFGGMTHAECARR